MQVRVRLWIFGLGEAQSFRGQLSRAEAPLAKAVLHLVDGQGSDVHQRSMILGTLKYPEPFSGAFAKANSVPSGGRSRSSRSVAVSQAAYRTCAMGSTFEVSSSFSLSM